MKPCKVIIEYPDGSIWQTDKPDEIRAIGLTLPRQVQWKKSANIDTLRRKYQAMLTELVKNTNGGYTKVDLHEAMKPLIISKFVDFPNYFIDGVFTKSTKNLTREGWIAMIEGLQVTSADIYNYYFK
jgi:hypothetical protein